MKGDIVACAKYVGEKFVYKYDKKGFLDQWFVMKDRDGKFYGDCDDFTITTLWYYYGCSLIAFIWNVIIMHNCKIYKVHTVSEGPHLVGCVNGMYFDNWTREALPRDQFFAKTQHQNPRRLFAFNYWLPLLIGLFFR